jgi:hypothetical protein
VPFLAPMISYDLEHNDLSAFARVIGELGIRYVVVTKTNDIQHGFYRVPAVSNLALESFETSNFVEEYAPTLIGQFGPFELRQLSDSISRPVLSVEPRPNDAGHSYLEALNLGTAVGRNGSVCVSQGAIRVRRFAPDHYHATLPPTVGDCVLVLRTAFSSGWSASISESGQSGKPARVSSAEVHGYANSFMLPTRVGARGLEIELVYRPGLALAAGGGILSGLSLAIAAWYAWHVGRVRKRRASLL